MSPFDAPTGDLLWEIARDVLLSGPGLMIGAGLVLICLGHLVERQKRSRA